MRFTQFGHQVPRRNSMIIGPRPNMVARVKTLPSRLADGSENSGARDPISKVSVRFCISIDFR